MSEFIRLNTQDHVAIAVRPLAEGHCVMIDGQKVTIGTAIPRGHKFAVRDVDQGGPVLKYGQPIGIASRPIGIGQHVHSHNLVDKHTVASRITTTAPPPSPAPIRRTFEGFARRDGSVGKRKYIAFISTVNCSATV